MDDGTTRRAPPPPRGDGTPLPPAQAITPGSLPAMPAHAGARQRYLALVRGDAQGVGPALQRIGLSAASVLYCLAVRVRNLGYERGCLRSTRVPAPVVSVGNLTVGGTGKTPFVEHVAGFYRRRDVRVAVLSRGYGADHGPNDEALVLEENLPDVPHLQGADRAALARSAIEELESDTFGPGRRLSAPPFVPRLGRGAARRDRPLGPRPAVAARPVARAEDRVAAGAPRRPDTLRSDFGGRKDAAATGSGPAGTRRR